MMNVEAIRKEIARIIIAALPGPDYPPSTIAGWIKECNRLGREDLGKQIMDWWNNHVINKYPDSRKNWKAATSIGVNSVKKNIFGRREFSEWLDEQMNLTPAQKREVSKVPTEAHIDGPAIAIPHADETPEDWQHAAKNTSMILDEVAAGFARVEDFVQYLNHQVADLKRKVADYGPGGSKSKTKSGAPSKLSERVPKWETDLHAYESKLHEVTKKVQSAKTKFKASTENYNNAPVTTVAYEKEAQKSLAGVLKFIMSMDDLNEQKDMLDKFQDMVAKMEKSKAASEKNAGFWDTIVDAFESIVDFFKHAWEKLVHWATGLFSAVEDFDDVASKLGR